MPNTQEVLVKSTSELTACECKQCGHKYNAPHYISKEFCSPGCEDEFNGVVEEEYEYVDPFPSFFD